MQLIRTTLRIKENLKEALEKRALEEKKTLQDLFNAAIEKFIHEEAEKKAKRIIFRTHDLGEKLDNLRRKDYYSDL
ncbi:hypothetical protein A2963_01540 [Candidatus Roizmanbacteria bacterium RIFCSPLOWO2_01_FULL_40_13]|nr:MAG: hypothetical protein A2963_01540 [Candidatus Roizmanbacteria bacterium RIFCSPLOWO2_01_FULL_40_13]